jgi:dTDP-4-dehydrorhamnose 3,5-epimerase
MVDVKELELAGVYEITPRRFGDHRGFFSETYSAPNLAAVGIDHVFIQDNHSLSRMAGVLRGLHYQLPPFAQDKLIRVIRGAILDVAVDVRKNSPTFGSWLTLEISAEKWNQILVPKGFAHGFVTLVPDTEVVYKVTERYAQEHEKSIRFDDPTIGIDWRVPATDITLSDKDRNAPLLADAEVFE